MAKYNKPALTFKEQVDLLRSRGLVVEDLQRAERHLSNVSYYRLSAYMRPFRKLDVEGKATDEFEEGTTWNDVYDLYRFDRKLRLLLFDAIERIEIALRTQLIYQLSHKYGSHWQTNPNLFQVKFDKKSGKKYDVFSDIKTHIDKILNEKQKPEFIQHYLDKYDDPPIPPSWMCMELMYFKELSQICQHIKDRQDRLDIAKAFGVPNDTVFCSWLHTINYVRNTCAHHSRLWNIKFVIQTAKFENEKPNKVWLTNAEVATMKRSKLYYFLCVILYLLQTVNPNSKFKQHFFDLLNNYSVVDVKYMGFPEDWKEHPLWRI
jgi:abortive infection bacteriophage resistance protein